MTALLYLLGVVVFVIAILVSIGLHELGHLVPAKKFGGKVTQYFVGFGPTVWSKQVGETEYGVKAIPLGGFVKIVGMLPPGAEQAAESVTVGPDGQQVTRVRRSNTGMFTQLISDARAAEYELVGAEDADRLFYKMAPWKKMVVMAAGPTVNLVIAFVLFLLVFSIYGIRAPEPTPGRPVVEVVSRCVLPFAEGDRACTDSDPVAPAYEAGLRPGDTITTFNGTAISDWQQLRTLIRDNAGGDAVIGYERDGQALEGTTNTTVQARPSSTDPLEADPALTQVGFLGVSPTTELVVVERGGPIYTLQQMGTMTVETVKALATLPIKVWDVAQAIVGLEERAADSPVSIVGGGRFAGETVSDERFVAGEKVAYVATLVAGFNFFIGMFNFVPLLPLDGGHIAGALWEWLRRGFARLRRRPDPGYVDTAKLLPIAYVVASAFLVMGVVLIVADLVVPLSLTPG